MRLLEGKKGVVMGIANDRSIATAIARQLHGEGAEIAISHLPDEGERNRNETRAKKIGESFNASLVAPCDVKDDAQIEKFFKEVQEKFGTIDFLVHSIAFAPVDDIRCPTLEASRAGFKEAMDVSVYSFIAVCRYAKPIMADGGSICSMSYFGGEKVLPGYNLMGVCKSALESATQYLAYDMGQNNIRVNAISAGPIKTLASSAVGDFKLTLGLYEKSAPLRRNTSAEEVGKSAIYLLSSLSSGTTGEILHVDCGYNIMGAPNVGE